MNTASNGLITSAHVYDRQVQVVPLSSPLIQLSWSTSPQIRLTVHKPVKTPSVRKPNTLTVLAIPRDSEIGGWRLKSVMLVQISHSRRGSAATTWFESVAEYGTGQGEAEAITDLVVSLGEYLEALEKRQKELGDSAQKELDYLRRLINRT